MEWIESLHWAWAIGFFWVVGIIRTSIIFSLGWLAASGGSRFTYLRSTFNHPVYQRASVFVNRWGVLAVPACFLTIGFQTAVIITTGFTHMPLIRWIPAMLLGTFIWGCIYGTVGMAVIWAWIEQPLVLLPLFVILIVLLVSMRWVRSRKAQP